MTAGGSGVFDPGLQPERTALAWRRTGLALGGGSLLLARVLAESSGALPLGLAVGAFGVLAAVLILVAVERRYRSHHHRLMAAKGERIRLAGGGLPAIVAATTGVLGIGALLAVILFAAQR